MRASIVTSLLALSPSICLGKPDAASTLTVGNALVVLEAYQSSILPYEQNINGTIAALGSNPTAAQKGAAAASVNKDLQEITSISNSARGSLRQASTSTSQSAGTVQDLSALVLSTSQTYNGTVNAATKSLGASALSTEDTPGPIETVICDVYIFLFVIAEYLPPLCPYLSIIE